MSQINFEDETLDASDGVTRLLLAAEYWKEKATTLRAELDALRGQKDEALNTLCKVFHAGEEFEGQDGMIMAVDLALWNEGCEAIERLVGGEEDGASPYARPAPAQSVPTETITDYLVSISAHVANRDDAQAQKELGELLKMLAAAPEVE